jgi:hypothetical protein
VPDPWSNQVVSQVIVGQAGAGQVIIEEVGGIGKALFPSGTSLESTTAHIAAGAALTGAAEFIGLDIIGPAITAQTDNVVIEMNSSNEGASSTANMEFVYFKPAGGGGVLVASFNGSGWSFGGGTALPVAAPTGYPLAGGAGTAAIVTTLNSLIANLIGANIVA